MKKKRKKKDWLTYFFVFQISQPKKKESGGGYDSYQTRASGWRIDAGKPSNNEGDPLDTV